MKTYRGQKALAFLSGDIIANEINIRCPNCHFDYTHIEYAGTLVGSDEIEAVDAYDGVGPTGMTSHRRSALEIVFSCENCPQFFAVVIQQSEGNNLIEIHADVRVHEDKLEGGVAE